MNVHDTKARQYEEKEQTIEIEIEKENERKYNSKKRKKEVEEILNDEMNISNTNWSNEDQDILHKALSKYGRRDLRNITACFNGRKSKILYIIYLDIFMAT